MKLVFMGTPDFAVPILESLHAGPHVVSLVVTQPDRPKGRGRALAAPPVKETALRLGLPVAQPESLKTPEFHEIIRKEAADLLVVVAFRILPDSLFPLSRLGAVNVHGSLLRAKPRPGLRFSSWTSRSIMAESWPRPAPRLARRRLRPISSIACA